MITKHRVLVVTACALLADSLFFSIADPLNASSSILFVGFVLLSASLSLGYFWLFILIRVTTGYPNRGLKLPVILVSSVSTFLLALGSVGQLTLRDAIAVILLCTGVFFYIKRYVPIQNS